MAVRKVLFGVLFVIMVALLSGLAGLPRDSQAYAPDPITSVLQKTPQKVAPEAGDPAAQPEQQSAPMQQMPAPSKIDRAIQTAFEQAAVQYKEHILGLLIYETYIDSIHYSQSGTTALVWVGLRDPETGEPVATEPGLAIADGTNPTALEDPASWSITLQSTGKFEERLQALPEDLLTNEIRMRYLEAPQTAPSAALSAPLVGYKLPWTAGVARRVTNSIGHYLSVAGGLTSCPSTCAYAYDFADGTMFPLLASKGGTVKSFKTTCPNYSTSCTNFLILEDQSTNPVSYQIYYHMAFDSVPARLRVVGAIVNQGEYIGDVDDTGYSTGHHLHYHVYHSRTQNDWSWGYSVDFKYDDVSDNNGHPRTCAEAAAYPNLGAQCQKENKYVSGNIPANPPSGTLTAPADRVKLDGKLVTVSGTAKDDISISRIQVIANYDGTWKVIDDIPPAAGPFSKEVDLCNGGVPDGPFALSVRIYDYEGSQASGLPVRQLVKNFTCPSIPTAPPPPACQPGDNQVALYADRDFRGACQRFNVNETGYTSSQLGAVGDNNAASIQVGKNVRAILYDRSSDVTATIVQGRVETLESSDANLADNRLVNDILSGLRVQDLSIPADEPFFNSPVGNRWSGSANPTSVDSLVLAWEGGEGATSFAVTLNGPTSRAQTVSGNSLSLGTLPAGSYSGVVTAKNSSGNNGTNFSFQVDAGSLPAAAALALPYQESFESGPAGWVASGLWRHTAVTVSTWPTTKAWSFNTESKNYNDATYRGGDLTSPPLTVPAEGVYYLRFAYYAVVEDGNAHWDQRRVHISVNGGAFTDLHQLVDDKQAVQSWLNSGPISLKDYAGKTIRLRFHFNAVDEDRNSGYGWVVDDVTINNHGPDTTCGDDGSIPTLDLNTTVSAVICPEGDFDLYKITGEAGKSIVLDIDAQTLNPTSSLDSIIYLLDADQRSVLAWNDDEKSGELFDSLLKYSFNRSGTYYLKVKAWDHPGAGGNTHRYNLTYKPYVIEIKYPKSVSLAFPKAPNMIPTMPFEMAVSAADFDGGPVKRVDFYWHGPDWNNPVWSKLPSDSNPADGWTVILDPLAYGQIAGSALYVQAISQMEGASGIVWWNLQPDTTPPTSSMEALPAVVNSTAFQVKWSGTDPSNDISYFDLQYQVNNGSWAAFPGSPFPAGVRSAWFTNGEQGKTYGFRVRGVDQMGNVEDFPNAAMASTQVSKTCQPDAGEVPGQTRANATSLAPNTKSPQMNICKSNQEGGGAGDEDWFALTLAAKQPLVLIADSQGGGAAFTLELFDQNGKSLAVWNSSGINRPAVAGLFTAPANGLYYLKLTGLNGQPYGTDVRYQLWYAPGQWLFLPMMRR